MKFSLKILDEPLFETYEFIAFERSYKETGISALIDGCSIFSPHLACILLSKDIIAINSKNKKEETFNGQLLISSFKKGYNEGIEFFNKSFPNANERIYGEKDEIMIRQLHENYYHSGFNRQLNRGWNWIKSFNAVLINEEFIFEQGYYSGIVAELDKLIDVHKLTFDEYDFIKCRTEDEGDPRKKNKKEGPESFEEMFEHPELIQDCIDVLKNVEPPILSDKDKYIGKYKSAFCVWIDKLKRKGLIKFYSDRSIYAKLISQRFSPFSIDESMFGKTHKRANELYQLKFDTLLSQVSQKIKKRK